MQKIVNHQTFTLAGFSEAGSQISSKKEKSSRKQTENLVLIQRSGQSAWQLLSHQPQQFALWKQLAIMLTVSVIIANG